MGSFAHGDGDRYIGMWRPCVFHICTLKVPLLAPDAWYLWRILGVSTASSSLMPNLGPQLTRRVVRCQIKTSCSCRSGPFCGIRRLLKKASVSPGRIGATDLDHPPS